MSGPSLPRHCHSFALAYECGLCYHTLEVECRNWVNTVEEIKKITEENTAEEALKETAEANAAESEVAQETSEANVAEAEVSQEAEAKKALPMKWHRFQKNFLLWVLALFCAVRAFLVAGGNIYYGAEIQRLIYTGLPLMRVLDYAFAAYTLAMGVLAVVSAGKLKKGSAKLLTKLNIMMAAAELAYPLLRWLISGLPPMNIQCAALLVVHLLLWRANREYYRNRDYLCSEAKS